MRLLKSRYLCGEVVREVLIAARIDELVTELVEHRWETDDFVAPGVAVAVIGKEGAHHFVGLQLPPHVGEDGDDVLKSPKIMIGVVEGLPRGRTTRRIGLTADEIRLPRAHGGDTGHLLDLALRRHWVGGFRSSKRRV